MSSPEPPSFAVDPAALFAALVRAPAALLDLGQRGQVRVTGSDRVRFLNGMLTNDVAKLSPGEHCPGLQLDRKGHVLAQLDAIAFQDALWLDAAPGTEGSLLEILERHLIADDVTLESRSATYGELVIEGPGAPEVVRAAGGETPEAGACKIAQWRGDELFWLGGGALTPTAVRVIAARDTLDALSAELDLPVLSEEATEVLRVEAFQPRLGSDVSDRNFPQEARLDTCISFTKGCYIGQEIVARIASRGAVNKLLVKLASERAVKPGDQIQHEGRSIGSVTSAVISPVSGALSLGYVKKTEAVPGTELEIAGVKARVLGPELSS